jgi:hypothetical protein
VDVAKNELSIAAWCVPAAFPILRVMHLGADSFSQHAEKQQNSVGSRHYKAAVHLL